MALLRSQPSGLPAGAQAQWQRHCSPKFTVINLNDCLYRAQRGTDPLSILRLRRAAFVSWRHLAPLPGLRKVGRWKGHPPPSAGAGENTPVRERGERLFKGHAQQEEPFLGPRSETQRWWVEFWPGLWEPWFWSGLNPKSQRDLSFPCNKQENRVYWGGQMFWF